MSRTTYLDCWLCGFLFLLGLAGNTDGQIVPEYYVSANGSDRNPGTEALPFKTIGRACLAMHGSPPRSPLPPGGVTVWIREGIYRETVRPIRSGTPEAPIRFVAYPGEEPVVSGADVLDVPWTLYAGRIYKAPTEVYFEQLFVDGQMMNEARWPNTPVRQLVRPTRATCDQGTEDATLVDNDLPPGDWNGAYVHINPSMGWSHSTKQIRNYNPQKSFDFSEAGWFDYRRQTRAGDRYWLFGALAGLDRATEWFLDCSESAENIVYLWCPGDPNPVNHRIEVKQRDHAFDLAEAHYISIEGLRMFTAGINMDNCTHCAIVRCHLKYPVYWRIVPPPTSWDLYLRGSNYMSGGYNEWKDCAIAYCAGAAIDDRGPHNKVTNCIIHDADFAGTVAGGISSTHGATGGEYTNNTIQETGAACIDIFHGSSLRVEHNDTFNSCLLCTEYGPIWTGWTDGAGTVIAYNLVHDSLDPVEGEGIVLETESRNYRVHHNLIWNIPLRGIKLNSPSLDNEIYNNTILSSCAQAFWSCCGPPVNLNQEGCKIINNIANAPMRFAKGAGAPEQHHNGYYAVDPDGWPTADSGAIDAGVVIPGITDGYVGAAPDIGCFEVGTEGWTAGADWEETAFTRSTRYLEGFETGDFIEFDWRFPDVTGWYCTSEEKNAGAWSATSGAIADNESTTLQVTLDCRSGEIRFWCKVSSEQNWDHLRFSIDGVEKAKWSGEQDWAEMFFPVSSGQITFAWTYSKDGSGSAGQDAAWIDDVVFPLL